MILIDNYDSFTYNIVQYLQELGVKPKFFEELQKNHNFFVCDFKEKDYFWMDSLSFTMIG